MQPYWNWCIKTKQTQTPNLLGTFEMKGMEKKRMKYDWWSELERENMGRW